MQSSAQTASQPGRATARTEADDGRSSLLGAGQFLEAVIEHIPAVVFVKDARDFRFILLNRAGEEFLGVKREAIIGRADHDAFPKDEAGVWTARRPACPGPVLGTSHAVMVTINRLFWSR